MDEDDINGGGFGRNRRSRSLDFTPAELDRLNKLEFVHSIGLKPVLGLKKGDQIITDNSSATNATVETTFNEHPVDNMAKETGPGDNKGNSASAPGNGVVNTYGAPVVVNTSDTTEPEDNSDEDESSSMTSTSSESRNQQDDIPKRKSYEELTRENEELRRLIDSRNKRLSELERVHEVIVDENALLSLEIQDIHKINQGEILKLKTELGQSENDREILTRRVKTLKDGVAEINKTLFYLLNQLNGPGNLVLPSSPTFLPPTNNANPRRSERESDTNNRSLAIGPAPLTSPLTATRSSSIVPTTTIVSPSSLNVIQLALQRLDGSGKFGTKNYNAQPAPDRLQQLSTSPQRIPAITNVTSTPTTGSGSKANAMCTTVSVYGVLPTSSPPNFVVSKENNNKKPTQIVKRMSLHAVDSKRQHQGFYCICGASVTSKLGLNTHIRYYTCEGQFRCTVKDCGRTFFTTSTLRMHMKAKHNLVYSGTQGCRRCGETFLSRMQLYTHCKNIHKCGPLIAGEKRKLMCRPPEVTNGNFSNSNVPCNRPVPPAEPTSSTLTKQQTKMKPNITVMPRNRVEDLSKLGGHAVDTSFDKSGRKICRCACSREFSSEQYLRMHIKYFTLEPKFPCKVCGRRYRGTNYLRQHMKIKHKMIYTGYGCRSCGRVFKSRTQLQLHQKLFHVQTLASKSKCTNVGTVENKPTSQVTLRSHRPTSPTSPVSPTMVHPVSAVPSTAKRQRKVPAKFIEESDAYPNRQPSRHLSQTRSSYPVHSPDKNCTNGFSCTCGTPFTTRSALLSHIKLRTAGCHFSCSVCPQKFPRPDYLRNHMLTNHKSQALPNSKNESSLSSNSMSPSTPSSLSQFPASSQHGVVDNPRSNLFKCLCGTQFTRKETLMEHIRFKLGLAQYQCDLCQGTYTRPDYLKVHMQRVHNVVKSGFACRICGFGGFRSTNDVKKHRSIHHNEENGYRDHIMTLTRER